MNPAGIFAPIWSKQAVRLSSALIFKQLSAIFLALGIAFSHFSGAQVGPPAVGGIG
jgi:hypothetical protein